MARPTDYNQDILDNSAFYLEYHNSEEVGDVVPSVAGLALHLGLSRPTIYDWITHDDKAEFSYIVDDILTKQEKCLLNGGLIGSYNPSITKLMLTKHGYTDKIENDNLHSFDLSSLSDEALQKLAGS